MRRAAVLFATTLGIGRAPIAPATVASFVVTAMMALLAASAPAGLGPLPLGLAIVVLTPIAIWSSGEAERELGTDAKPIVVDEVVGMLVSVWGITRMLEPRPWLFFVAAFLLFRLFDILKPFPIRGSQALPGGYGVVADDLLAGLATNVALRLLLLAGVRL